MQRRASFEVRSRSVTMPARVTNVAVAAPGRNVVPQPVELALVIPVESVEDAQEVPLLVAPDDRVLVQVATNGVGADIPKLQTAEEFARCEEGGVDDVVELSPRVSPLTERLELTLDAGFP